MRLLILTQKVDIDDGVLGFFHNWLEKFAQRFEKITVICLEKGEHKLPNNINVFSLGKENGGPRLKYLFNFYKYIWRKRKEYDAVFIHMNQEYAILGGLFWKILGKKIFLWRNHKMGSFFTAFACKIADAVFYTSPFAFVARFKNAKIMPVGIDTKQFKSQISNLKSQNTILSLGRIDPVKNVHILIKALKLLNNFSADIYGSGEGEYYNKLKKEAGGLAVFHGDVPNYKTPEIYNQHEIFVNLTPAGSFDKTILEAMACGCIPVVCNKSLKNILGDKLLFKEGDTRDLAEKIKYVLNLSDLEKENYRNKFIRYVKTEHSLDKLAGDLNAIIKKYGN